MPLLSFEGVEVEVPTDLQGIQFTFVNGALSIQCTNFTGAIVMAKPTASIAQLPMSSKPMALSDFPTVQAAKTEHEQLIIQTTQTSTLSSLSLASSTSSSSSKKRSIPDEQDDPDMVMDSDDSDDRENDLLRKRIRPNFLSDVEQTMLLAQLETSQQSLRDASAEMVDATQPEPEPVPMIATSPEKTNAATAAATSQANLKTPAKAKKPSVSHMKSFFSPEPKELAKKTPESANKRGATRAPSGKAAKSDATQISIRDMMLPTQTTPTKTLVHQPTPATATWSQVATTGTAPCERWGHTVTKISDNRVVVYGGADDNEATLGDLHVFNLTTNEWTKPLNCESIPRTWHDAVYLASKHLMLVFGGERVVGNDQQLDVLSDIMVLDTECFLWYPPAVSGVTPAARSGHACTVVGSDVVVFGGSRGRSRQSAVHVLDSDAWHWKQVKIEGKPPSARTYHSAVAMGGDSVVYFGGNDSKKSFDSVHVLKKHAQKPDVWTWFHPCVVGTAPRARTGHSATLSDDGTKILIFGGWDPQTSPQSDANGDNASSNSTTTAVFSDAFLLNTVTWEWESVQPQGQGDAAAEEEELLGRVGHSAVSVGGSSNTVLLFGGQNANEQRLNVVHALTLGSGDAKPTSA